MTIQELTTFKVTLNRCIDEAYKNKSMFLADELLKCRDWVERDLRLKTTNPVTGESNANPR